MLDMGFSHDIRRVMALLPKRRQNLLFSATFSPEIRALAKSFLHQPVEVSVTPPNSTVDKIKQTIHPVDKAQKAALLCHLAHSQQWKQALIFSRTKHGANKLVKILAGNNIEAAAFHGNKSQSQRTRALDEFKSGKIRLLVATDIAARGIDIDQLPLVVNFDLPQVPEDYVHRIGRTGRAGSSGVALSLVSADEAKLLHAIEKLTKNRLHREEVDDFEPQHCVPESPTPAARPQGQGQQRRHVAGGGRQSAGRRR
jgi:ATP-dependent RNA helicase RhlE